MRWHALLHDRIASVSIVGPASLSKLGPSSFQH